MRDYIQQVIRTESTGPYPNARVLQNMRGLHACMGINTESGELTDIFKKHIFYGKPIDWAHVKEELGDLLWYIAILCSTGDMSFDEIMETNIAKLKSRFPEKFDLEKALNRDLAKEGSILGKKEFLKEIGKLPEASYEN